MNPNLRIKHFRVIGDDGRFSPFGGLTVVYLWDQRKGGHVLEMATAVCSRLEVFSRKAGRDQALYDFTHGKTVYLPVKNREITATILHLGSLVNLGALNYDVVGLVEDTEWLSEVQSQLASPTPQVETPKEEVALEYTRSMEEAARSYVGQFGEFNIPETFSFKELFTKMVEAKD